MADDGVAGSQVQFDGQSSGAAAVVGTSIGSGSGGRTSCVEIKENARGSKKRTFVRSNIVRETGVH